MFMVRVVMITNIHHFRGLFYLVLYIVFFSSLLSCQEQEETVSGSTFTKALYNNPQNKLWAHQMNSPDTALKRIQEFNGIELDVIFETELNKFNVRHDIEAASSDIYLDAYFKILEKSDMQIYYWLDFKNLESNNLQPAIDRLLFLLKESNLKDRVIVESFNATELIEINKNGIYTSFWIPHLYSNATKDDTTNCLSLIKYVVNSGQVNAISAHNMMYSFIHENFPNQNVHLWTNGLISEQDKEVIYSLDDKPDIKVILVDYRKNFTQ